MRINFVTVKRKSREEISNQSWIIHVLSWWLIGEIEIKDFPCKASLQLLLLRAWISRGWIAIWWFRCCSRWKLKHFWRRTKGFFKLRLPRDLKLLIKWNKTDALKMTIKPRDEFAWKYSACEMQMPSLHETSQGEALLANGNFLSLLLQKHVVKW